MEQKPREKFINFIRSIPKSILIVLGVVSVAFIVIPTFLYFLSDGDIPLDSLDYGLTIDAGSSKTKFVLYDWKSLKENGTGLVSERASEKLKIRIDEHANNLINLVRPLETTLQKVADKINETRQSFQIPIYLG